MTGSLVGSQIPSFLAMALYRFLSLLNGEFETKGESLDLVSSIMCTRFYVGLTS